MIWQRPVCVIDVETTGFHAEAEVVEVGMVVIQPDGFRHGGALLARPENPIDDRAMAALEVNGIPPAALYGAPHRDEVRAALMDALAYFQIAQITSFNVSFDRRFLERFGVPPDTLPWGPCIWKEAKAATQKVPAYQRPAGTSLLAIAGWLNIVPAQPGHRALPDAQVAASILLALEGMHP